MTRDALLAVPLWAVLTAAGEFIAVTWDYSPLGAAEDEALVVRGQGSRWVWIMTYPEQGLTTTELVLPRGREVRFEVTATDVLHSF